MWNGHHVLYPIIKKLTFKHMIHVNGYFYIKNINNQTKKILEPNGLGKKKHLLMILTKATKTLISPHTSISIIILKETNRLTVYHFSV